MKRKILFITIYVFVLGLFEKLERFLKSGYGKQMRREILKAGVKRYYRPRLQEEVGGRSLYRSLQEMAPQRSSKQMMTRTWFRPRRGGNKVSLQMDYPQPHLPRMERSNIGKWG